MGSILYRSEKKILCEQLADLFLSVDWASGHYPDRLCRAIGNSDQVFSAWDGEMLVGLLNVLDDGEMTAYAHYLLVRPEYQHKGIGKELIRMLKETYKDYLRIVLVSYNDEIPFYERCGFKASEGSTPMFITSLWT